MRVEKFIYYSTIISIFTEAAGIYVGFDLKLFYIVVFINFFILLLNRKIFYTKGLLVFHAIIILSGLYSCIFGYNPLGYYLIQLFFLLLIPVYYYSFYSFFKKDLYSIVYLYCKLSFALAIIGILKFPYDKSQGLGLHSLLLEPAHYCAVILPAFFITLKDLRFPRAYCLVILVSIVLSGSSLGFIGLGLAMILYVKKLSFVKIITSTALVYAIGLGVYSSSPDFKLRVDDTINSYVTGDLSEANLSTYALLSNFFVSYQSFSSNPLLGNGIGSHVRSRALYLGNIEGIEIFEKMGADHLNAQDAGSLFSRIMSELGLVGIIGVFYFIIKFYVPYTNKKKSFNSMISKAIILYFFSKLFREGHYFSPEMYFFVFLYVYNKYDAKIGCHVEKERPLISNVGAINTLS